MGNTSKILLALLAGAAAGIAIGIMIAPEKGSESRQKVKDTTKKLADSILETAEEMIDDIGRKKHKA